MQSTHVFNIFIFLKVFHLFNIFIFLKAPSYIGGPSEPPNPAASVVEIEWSGDYKNKEMTLIKTNKWKFQVFFVLFFNASPIKHHPNPFFTEQTTLHKANNSQQS